MIHPENVKIRRNFKCILLNERSHHEKDITAKLQLYDILEKAKLWRQ
jgi:hypothetical protein